MAESEMVERTMRHLGQVLYMLNDLHADDRSAAFDAALAFYNEHNPQAKIAAEPGFVTRLVHETPMSRAIAALQEDTQ